MDQIEAPAPEPRARGLDDGQSGGYRNCGIESVAALGKYFFAGPARERRRARDGSFVRNGGVMQRRGALVICKRDGTVCRRNQPEREEPSTHRICVVRPCVGRPQLLRCRFNSTSTMGCTNSETLPPNTAISRTKVEEMNVYCSCGVMKTDSISGVRWRLILAN